MKKIMSVLLAIALLVALAVPAAAATPAKYSDATTNDQKIEWIKDTYGFGSVGKFSVIVNGKWTADEAAIGTALDVSQRGFALVGNTTVKKIMAAYDESKLKLNSKDAGVQAGGFGNGILEVKENAPVSIVIHETMHAFDGMVSDEGLLKTAGAKAMASVNGNYSGYTNTNQYVTQYAATSASEDFAETSESMILNGGDLPCTLGKDTKLYKKYKACYDLLLENFGVKSNAVIRSAAFLGLELPKE